MSFIIKIVKILPSFAKLLYDTIKILPGIMKRLADIIKILTGLSKFVKNPLWQNQNHTSYY